MTGSTVDDLMIFYIRLLLTGGAMVTASVVTTRLESDRVCHFFSIKEEPKTFFSIES